jgi:hypothetical protein
LQQPPTLESVLVDAGRVFRLAPEVGRLFRLAYSYAYSPRSGDGVAVRTSGGDPTGSVALADGKLAARSRVATAGEHIADALASLNAAATELRKSLGDMSRDPMKQAGPFRRTVTRAEVRVYREAAARRAARGDE